MRYRNNSNRVVEILLYFYTSYKISIATNVNANVSNRCTYIKDIPFGYSFFVSF